MKRRRSSRARRGRAKHSALGSPRDITMMFVALVVTACVIAFAQAYAAQLRTVAIVLGLLAIVVGIGMGAMYGYRLMRSVTEMVTRGLDRFVRVRPYQRAGLRQLQAVPAAEFKRLVLLIFEQRGYRVRLAQESSGLIIAHLHRANDKRALAICEDAHRRALTQLEVAALSGVCEGAPASMITLGSATADARAWARAHNIEIVDGAAFMTMLWRVSRDTHNTHSYSIARALVSPALTAPEHVMPTALAREYQRVVAGWVAKDQKDVPSEGCSKYWPELCAR